jgi:hypothetical protein
VLDAAIPTTIPIADAVYKPPVEIAISSLFTLACNAMNVAENARPVPNPLGMISKLSNQDVSPFHRMIKSPYEIEAHDVARSVSILYRPVRCITIPARRLPNVLLRTAGRR